VDGKFFWGKIVSFRETVSNLPFIGQLLQECCIIVTAMKISYKLLHVKKISLNLVL